MSLRSIQSEIQEQLARDAYLATTQAWTAQSAGATIGWDDSRGQWWVACETCGIAPHYTDSLDVAECTVSGHNRRAHN